MLSLSPRMRVYAAAQPIDFRKGFDGLELRVDISGREGIEISKILFHAYPFYNGQMTSMTPPAVFEIDRPRIPAAGEWRIKAPSFAIPDLDAHRSHPRGALLDGDHAGGTHQIRCHPALMHGAPPRRPL